MAARQLDDLTASFRAAPAKCALLTGGPVLLAAAQLANSALNGLSPLAAIGFAVAMGAFAVVATGHHVAEYRLARLERELRISR